MSRILVVSNRLPVTVRVERGRVSVERSAGGLATGMAGLHEEWESLWVGWPGELPRMDARTQEEVFARLEEQRLSPVLLKPSDVTRFYEGFSNGVLWPLYHYLTDRVERDAWAHWRTFVDVNRKFADQVARLYREGDLVWVHDYQLSLVPAMLRTRLPQALIGYFLHIPFPAAEVFRVLPWRLEILEGMLGADLLGFHTHAYVSHFRDALGWLLGMDVEGDQFSYGARRVTLEAFPMGIDVETFEKVASSPEVRARMAELALPRGKKLLLGVDRLDYTKGLHRRLLAFERLLEVDRSLRGHVCLVQVVVPSRTGVSAYEDYRRRLDELVGHINSVHGTLEWQPVRFLFRSISKEEMVALYRLADVMIVTPVRDGMNLVAKEFIASRLDDDGVLVLSEFAGAASELREAVVVNPYDLDGVASSLREAIAMPREERGRRMHTLRLRVRTHDAADWGRTFVEALRSHAPTQEEKGLEPSPRSVAEDVLRRAWQSSHLLLLLDYDGTLVPFADRPEQASPDPDLLALLRGLSERPGTEVHLVSGRPRETLEDWFGGLPIGLHAEHGIWSFQDGRWEPLRDQEPDWKGAVRGVMDRAVAAITGTWIEEKAASVGWHYRTADPVAAGRWARQMRRELEESMIGQDLEVLCGARILEARVRGVHKGLLVERLLASRDRENPVVLAMGDDRTDEDLFASLPPQGLAVHVGPTQSRAPCRLRDVADARAFLRLLLPLSSPDVEGSGGREGLSARPVWSQQETDGGSKNTDFEAVRKAVVTGF